MKNIWTEKKIVVKASLSIVNFQIFQKKKSTDAIPPKTPKVYDEKFSNPIFPNKTR